MEGWSLTPFMPAFISEQKQLEKGLACVETAAQYLLHLNVFGDNEEHTEHSTLSLRYALLLSPSRVALTSFCKAQKHTYTGRKKGMEGRVQAHMHSCINSAIFCSVVCPCECDDMRWYAYVSRSSYLSLPSFLFLFVLVPGQIFSGSLYPRRTAVPQVPGRTRARSPGQGARALCSTSPRRLARALKANTETALAFAVVICSHMLPPLYVFLFVLFCAFCLTLS